MKFTNDFSTVNAHLNEMIKNEISKSLNAKLVFVCKDSNHPDDNYLYLYVAKANDDTYIAGLANTSRHPNIGLYENHYGCTFKQAMEITINKIHDCNKGEN